MRCLPVPDATRGSYAQGWNGAVAKSAKGGAGFIGRGAPRDLLCGDRSSRGAKPREWMNEIRTYSSSVRTHRCRAATRYETSDYEWKLRSDRWRETDKLFNKRSERAAFISAKQFVRIMRDMFERCIYPCSPILLGLIMRLYKNSPAHLGWFIRDKPRAANSTARPTCIHRLGDAYTYIRAPETRARASGARVASCACDSNEGSAHGESRLWDFILRACNLRNWRGNLFTGNCDTIERELVING